MVSAADVAAALDGRRCGSRWIARCPAHDHGNPSLSIAEGRAGRVLVHCFAGCARREVLRALRRRGLLPPPRPRTAAEGRARAERRRLEREASDFARAAQALAEIELEQLPAADPHRRVMTEMLEDLKRNSIELLRVFREINPRLAAALVHAGRRSLDRTRRRARTLVEMAVAELEETYAIPRR